MFALYGVLNMWCRLVLCFAVILFLFKLNLVKCLCIVVIEFLLYKTLNAMMLEET